MLATLISDLTQLTWAIQQKKAKPDHKDKKSYSAVKC